MSGTMLNALHELCHFIHTVIYIEECILIFPVVIRKSKFRVLKNFFRVRTKIQTLNHFLIFQENGPLSGLVAIKQNT